MTFSTARRLVLLLLLASLTPVSTRSQQNKRTPDEKPRNIKKELKKAYVDWIKDVELILTTEDRSAWDKLKTDDEREQFIQLFWRQRDPDPDTEENEFKEQFYERVAYVNEHFSSGKPGRLTDRGRVYIKFGKPDEIESHPTGGPYQLPPNEGSGSATTYPFEKWFYRYIPGVGSGIELEFIDPTSSGEFRIARDPDEKFLAGVARLNPIREPVSPLDRLILQSDLERDLPIDRRWYGTKIDTPKVDENPLTFEAQLNYFRQTDNHVLTVLTLLTEDRELVFKDGDQVSEARLNIFGRITSVADRPIMKFEESVITTAKRQELSSGFNRKSAYAKSFILAAGRYRIDVLVRDVVSGATGVKRIGFEVPAFSSDRLVTSSIVLAAKLESLKDTVAGGPFAIGPTKVVPNLMATYRQGEPVGVYLEVYNAEIDQTTLRRAIDVYYVLLRDGKELNRHAVNSRDINETAQRLTLTRLLDTRDLQAGEYQIQVNIQDQITGYKLSPTAKFTVVQ